jgi:peptidoglycan/LPS O-acetylase OafA/YrhL
MTAPPPPHRDATPIRRGNAIWGLQCLRFVAAAMVLISHLNHEVLQRPALDAGFVPFAPVWWAGGVDVFFVISGFIMLHVSADQFGRPGAVRRFAERRIVRLVPLYWMFTLLALVAMALLPGQMAHNRVTPAQIVGSLLFIPVAAPDGRATPVLILGWTLEFEMLFYAVFAAGLGLPRRRGITMIVMVLLVLAALALVPPLSGPLSGPLPLPLGFWANPIVLEFLFGMGLALAFGRGWVIPRAAGLVLAGLGIAALVWVQARGWPGHAWMWRMAWAGVPSLLICAGVVLAPGRARPGAVARLFILLGDASYALYLSHPFALSLMAMAAARMPFLGAAGYIAMAFAVCVAVSVVIHLWIEGPLQRAIAARLAQRRDRARPPQVIRMGNA